MESCIPLRGDNWKDPDGVRGGSACLARMFEGHFGEKGAETVCLTICLTCYLVTLGIRWRVPHHGPMFPFPAPILISSKRKVAQGTWVLVSTQGLRSTEAVTWGTW